MRGRSEWQVRPVYLKELRRRGRRRPRQSSRSSVSSVEEAVAPREPQLAADVAVEGGRVSPRPVHPWHDTYVLKVHTQNPYFSCC